MLREQPLSAYSVAYTRILAKDGTRQSGFPFGAIVAIIADSRPLDCLAGDSRAREPGPTGSIAGQEQMQPILKENSRARARNNILRGHERE